MDPAASAADPAHQVIAPLMSLEVPGPQDIAISSSEEHSQEEPADSQDVLLFSQDVDHSPDSLSPSISSFTSSSFSQSILKNVDPIVSSGPKVVEQIPANASNVSSNSSVEGPKVTHGNNNSKSVGCKGASNSNSSSSNNSVKAALNKLRQLGSSNSVSQFPNSQIPNSQIPKFQILRALLLPPRLAKLSSMTFCLMMVDLLTLSRVLLTPPLNPLFPLNLAVLPTNLIALRPLRALSEFVLTPLLLVAPPELTKACLSHRQVDHLDALKLSDPPSIF